MIATTQLRYAAGHYAGRTFVVELRDNHDHYRRFIQTRQPIPQLRHQARKIKL